MNRFTYRGTNGKGYVRNDGYYNSVYLRLEQVAERLTAYEDTGLEPEEIEAVLDKYGRGFTAKTAFMEELYAYRAIGTPDEFLAALHRTAEDDKAREEGRLVEFKSKADAAYAKAMFEAIENCDTSCISDCRRCSGVHDIAAEAALGGGEGG